MFDLDRPTPPAGRRTARGSRFDGPYPRLPRPLDALSEGWARLRPRVRIAVSVLGLGMLALAVAARIERAERRWGGPAVDVLVAEEDLPVGATELAVRAVQRPPAAVPEGAVTAVPEGASLAFAVPAGSVLTAAHLDPRGPAVALPPGSRAVPIPVDEGWGVTAGGRVDVWVLGPDGTAPRQVAVAAPVLQVSGDGQERTALVGLADGEVGPTTQGLATGGVLLTHAPPDGQARAPPAAPAPR